MKEIEQIETLTKEISERNEKIKEAIFAIVKIYGEIECPDRSYKIVENTGANSLVEAFKVEDEKLTVRTNFDGDIFDLEADSFNTVELANVLTTMLSDKRRQTIHHIEKLNEEYMADHDDEPLYADCSIMFVDDGSVADITIKLSCGSEEDDEDSDIFYYCNSVSCLKHFTEAGINDFIITSVNSLWRQ